MLLLTPALCSSLILYWFYMPAGYGKSISLSVTVAGQTSAAFAEKFSYEAPSMMTIRPSCGFTYDDLGNQVPILCYGFMNPGFDKVEDYPKILSVTAGSIPSSQSSQQLCRVSLQIAKPFPIAIGDIIQLAGLESSIGQVSGKKYNFNGRHKVTNAVDGNTFEFQCVAENGGAGINPDPDVYLGWNMPQVIFVPCCKTVHLC